MAVVYTESVKFAPHHHGTDLFEERIESHYRRYGPRLIACAMAVVLRQDLAEEAMHVAFERILRKRPLVIGLKAYLFRAVYHSAIDIRRREQRRGTWNDAVEFQGLICHAADDPADRSEMAELYERAERLLDQLPEATAEVIRLHLTVGLTLREIANACDRPFGTVASQYRRGIESIRKQMGTDEQAIKDERIRDADAAKATPTRNAPVTAQGRRASTT